ncbi:MAG: hypothetical protein P8166_18200, partial [Candidatus Thiodiazotropha sp.]
MNIHFKPISISLFTAFFVSLFLILLFIFGRVTFQQIDQLDRKFHQTNQARAEAEIDRALDLSIDIVRRRTLQLAEWEEVRQQLNNPSLYSYWYRHRSKNNNLISSYIIDVALYNSQGGMLNQIDTALLPGRIDPEADREYIEMDQFEPLLVVIEPVREQAQNTILGYVATLSRIVPLFQANGQFNLVNAATINPTLQPIDRIDAQDIKSLIRYQLNSDEYTDALRQVMTETLLRLASLAGILSLIIFPLAARIMSRPIRQISQHIDALKLRPREPVDHAFQ